MNRLPLEWQLAGLAVAAGLPALGTILYTLTGKPVRDAALALLAISVASLLGGGWLIRSRLNRAHRQAEGLLLSLRDGDYALRAVPARGRFGAVLAALNALADDMAGIRRSGIESDALLGKLLAAVDLAILVFGPNRRLVGANAAAEGLLGLPIVRMLGMQAAALGIGEFLALDGNQRVAMTLPGGVGPWDVRAAKFRRGGKPYDLLAVSDASRAMRAEERRTWRRLIRVLSHETGNSLGPIQATAEALQRRLQEEITPELVATLGESLALIERRAKSLAGFIRRYAELARLPPPKLEPVELAPLMRRVTALETRMAITAEGPGITIKADPAQLEQALINLIRNAADAALEMAASADIAWMRKQDHVVIEITDAGPGLPSTDNLFVPFFTTKPGGNGIGLVLAREIIEAHGGTLSLADRVGRSGVTATILLKS